MFSGERIGQKFEDRDFNFGSNLNVKVRPRTRRTITKFVIELEDDELIRVKSGGTVKNYRYGVNNVGIIYAFRSATHIKLTNARS